MKIDDNKIRLLVDKYFEGQTSLNEERTVREYFAHEDIAPDLKYLQPLFLYFNQERATIGNDEISAPDTRKPAHKPTRRIMLWTSIAAAACTLLIIGHFQNLSGSHNTSMAYIDGKQCTHLNLICNDALDALNALTDIDESAISAQIQAINELTINF
jgi:hypothetical protein